MNFVLVVTVGALVGALDGGGIFFVPEEPHKTNIFVAAIIKGCLVSLLTAFSLHGAGAWWHGVLYGALYGFLFASVVFLSKGGARVREHLLILPYGLVSGALIGFLVWRLF